MKKIIFTAAIIFIGITAIAQNNFFGSFHADPLPVSSKDLSYDVHGRYARAVTDGKLHNANRISDVIEDYPANWISEYISLEILATCNGKPMGAVSANDVLTTEQKNILKSADLTTDVVININYKSENTLSSTSKDKSLNYTVKSINITMTVVPETQAGFIGGNPEIRHYLKINAMSKISDSTAQKLQAVLIAFIINEEGEVENTKLLKSSNDLATDKLLVDAINNMPKWTPAKNFRGIKVKQQFEFSVGMSGC